MIKYPLYVTLDTNIFDANKLDFSQDSTLGLLVNHVKAGKIKIVLSNIVLKRSRKTCHKSERWSLFFISWTAKRTNKCSVG